MFAREPQCVTAVAVAIADSTLREQTYVALGDSPARVVADVSAVSDTRDLAVEVARARPDVLMLGLTEPAAFAEVARTLRMAAGGPKLVAISRSADPGMILQAMRAGATEYLYPPFGPEFAEALARLEAGRGNEGAPRSGQTIAFVSSKGGCGATSLACHAALALRRAGKATLLADLDFNAGVAAMCLETVPRYTLADAIGSLDRLDATLWKALAAQGPDGMDLIAASPAPMEFGPNESALRSLTRFWKSQYELTVTDLGHGVTASLLGLAPEFDHIALVITDDAAALRMARQALHALQESGNGGDRVRLILNRAEKRPAIPPAEIERLLECPLFGTIPLDSAAAPRDAAGVRSIQPGAAMGTAIARLAGKMTGVALEGERRRFSLFGRGR
jgi:pilus assembly protein CpaE